MQCKSRVYSGEYDIGDYRAVRQGVQLVRDAVSDWTSFREFIREHPLFDNGEIPAAVARDLQRVRLGRQRRNKRRS